MLFGGGGVFGGSGGSGGGGSGGLGVLVVVGVLAVCPPVILGGILNFWLVSAAAAAVFSKFRHFDISISYFVFGGILKFW